MSHFQIFIPNTDAQGPEALVAVGLSHLGEGFDSLRDSGPGDAQGMYYAWRSPADNTMGYFPESWTWTPAVASDGLQSGRYWVGIKTDDPPTPKQLQRPYLRNGIWATLGDGNDWAIPRAMELPQDIIFADDGSLKYEIQREFNDFWMESIRWRDTLKSIDPDSDDFSTTITDPQLVQFAYSALSINYRMTREVMAGLRLLSTDNVAAVMYVVVDALNGGDNG